MLRGLDLSFTAIGRIENFVHCDSANNAVAARVMLGASSHPTFAVVVNDDRSAYAVRIHLLSPCQVFRCHTFNIPDVEHDIKRGKRKIPKYFPMSTLVGFLSILQTLSHYE